MGKQSPGPAPKNKGQASTGISQKDLPTKQIGGKSPLSGKDKVQKR